MTEGEAAPDAFESACVPVRRLYELMVEASDVWPESERLNELESEGRSLFADDVENVTRYGVVRGPDHLMSEVRTQLEQFRMKFDVDLREGRAGEVVALIDARREMREDPSNFLTVHSGAVYRVQGGRIVFLEGFPDGRDALRAGGLPPSGPR